MKKVHLQFFAKVIDLTEKLSNEKPSIKIGDRVYELNDGFKTIVSVDNIFKNGDLSQVEQIEKFFVLFFGKENATELLEKDYHISFYKEILSACLELVKGDDEDSGK